MPRVVARAMVAAALLWRWVRMATLISLAWAGLLRPAEFLLAQRSDLVLPRDVLFNCPYDLFCIDMPKTWNTGGPLHQAARIDDPLILLLLDAVFAFEAPSSRLWTGSSQSFRKRFQSLLSALGLPPRSTRHHRALDPGLSSCRSSNRPLP